MAADGFWVPRHSHGTELQRTARRDAPARCGRVGWRRRAACAERPRTAASSRRDAVSVCAWAEDNASAAANVNRRSGG
jgi:hypothetical protein